MQQFDYSLNFKRLNFRDRPNLYQLGRGEQGAQAIETALANADQP